LYLGSCFDLALVGPRFEARQGGLCDFASVGFNLRVEGVGRFCFRVKDSGDQRVKNRQLRLILLGQVQGGIKGTAGGRGKIGGEKDLSNTHCQNALSSVEIFTSRVMVEEATSPVNSLSPFSSILDETTTPNGWFGGFNRLS